MRTVHVLYGLSYSLSLSRLGNRCSGLRWGFFQAFCLSRPHFNVHEYKQVWCYQTDFRPVRKELEGEKKKAGKETKKGGKGPDGEVGEWERERKERVKGAGGGGDRKLIRMFSLSTLRSTLPIELIRVHGGGGGGGWVWGWILEFVDTFWSLLLLLIPSV